MCRMTPESILRIQMTTNLEESFPLALFVDMQPVDMNVSIILAAIVLLGLYVVIITEVSSKFYSEMYYINFHFSLNYFVCSIIRKTWKGRKQTKLEGDRVAPKTDESIDWPAGERR